MASLKKYQSLFNSGLKSLNHREEPRGLYAPVEYLLKLGGKRLRPVLVLMATEAFGKKPKEGLPAALCVEVFHNFTLMHDDIMDDAPLRRGQATVHEKWDVNTGILSGDAMLIQAYQFLENYPVDLQVKLTQLLSKTAIEVCEGQQYDIDFESQKTVTIDAYLQMIKLKTAVLVGCSLKMGAWIGGASDEDAQLIYDFGVLLGIAFQVQDDYLDAFGDPETFGKQVGGDIIENKKTILFHKTMEKGTPEQKADLLDWFENTSSKEVYKKIEAVKALFVGTGAAKQSREFVEFYTHKAFKKLDQVELKSETRAVFKAFGQNLMERKF
ncbi:MAG: polyprenyl synthetase family protein [Flavobacteriaceae bacterium]